MTHDHPRATQAGTQPDTSKGQPEVHDADNPKAMPHGTTKDQIANMENEGQAQPQADERAPEDSKPSTTTGDRGGVS